MYFTALSYLSNNTNIDTPYVGSADAVEARVGNERKGPEGREAAHAPPFQTAGSTPRPRFGRRAAPTAANTSATHPAHGLKADVQGSEISDDRRRRLTHGERFAKESPLWWSTEHHR